MYQSEHGVNEAFTLQTKEIMFRFFALPEDIVLALLSQWLRVCEIRAVDGAVCNRTLRPTFLKYLQDDAFVLTRNLHSDISFEYECLCWLNSRSVGVEEIFLQAVWFDFPIDFLLKKGHVIKQFSFFGFADCLPVSLVEAVAANCPELEVISGIPINSLFVDAIRLFRQNCAKLHSITSTSMRSVTSADTTVQVVHAMQALCEGGNSVLENLTLTDCADINDALTIAARNCPNLRTLTGGGHNVIQEATVRIIAEHCHHLKSLSLGYALQLTDAALVALGSGCPNLTDFRQPIHSPPATVDGLRGLTQGCPNLTSLFLHNPSEEGIAVVVENCKHLVELRLHGRQELSLASCQAIGRHCSNLISLGVDDRHIPWVGLSALARGCHKLTRLTCSYYSSVTDVVSSSLYVSWPSLHELCVIAAENLSDADLEAIGSCCPNLTKVTLFGCSNITSIGLTALALSCAQLADVYMYGCQSISEKGAIALAQHCPELKAFELLGCNTLTDAALVALGAGCHKLESIALNYCALITSAGLTALARGCPQLQLLFLNGCTNVTDDGIIAVGRHCKALTDIYLLRTTAFTDAAIERLVEDCPRLRELTVSEGHTISNNILERLTSKGIRFTVRKHN